MPGALGLSGFTLGLYAVLVGVPAARGFYRGISPALLRTEHGATGSLLELLREPAVQTLPPPALPATAADDFI